MENEPKDLRELSKEQLLKEGNTPAAQFNEWRALFDIECAVRKHELPEIDKWGILSGRWILIDRERQSDYKLFTKEEVLRMIQDAYCTGWNQCSNSYDRGIGDNKSEPFQEYMKSKESI